jgi:epoxide hydrolase-like predicted phosphatase
VYKAIIFDLGKVLIYFDFKRGYQALEGLCPYTAVEIPKRIAATDLVDRFETGLVEPQQFFEELSRILGLNLQYDRFCQIWSSIFGRPLVPENMLEGLAARYRLVLLSNTNAIHFAMVRQAYPLLRHFHELVLSYEVKAMKPDPRIFQQAVARAGCRPEECFYTDDIAAYVEGARKLGIDAVQFESAEQIQREMAARRIRWE